MRCGFAQSLDEELAQQAESDSVEQERALAGETQNAAARLEAEQLPEVEIARPHGGNSFHIERSVYQYESARSASPRSTPCIT